MNRSAFYASVRQRASGVFGTTISQSQVQGIEAILDEAERRGTPLQHLAYILATAYHESAHTMQAVRETLATTDAGAIRALESSWKRGKLPWVKTTYWRKDPDGKSWFGRGLVQITHKANYAKLGLLIGVDLVKNPSKALDLPTAIEILFVGMELGSFTGKSLSDYISDGRADYEGARRIVNGTDKAALIADYAKAFEKALRDAGYTGKATQPSVIPPPEPKPAAPDKPAVIAQGQVPSGGWLAALLSALAKLLKGGKA
ncbi:glycoside hydrolase family 19 protein [Shinella sp. M31]|uniref:glycoside hydrolase family 19 protein n=1 Tax=Shinella sp. M31 TaxID=3368615 RepID=UPI003B9EDD11